MEITFYRKLANKVSDAVVANGQYDDISQKRIRYGLVCIFSDLYKFILYFAVFAALGYPRQCITAFVALILLRPFLGGHAKNELNCIILSFTILSISIFGGQVLEVNYIIKIILMIIFPVTGLVIASGIKKKIPVALFTQILLIYDLFICGNHIILIIIIISYLFGIKEFIKRHKSY
jgi:accessory gene regulator B